MEEGAVIEALSGAGAPHCAGGTIVGTVRQGVGAYRLGLGKSMRVMKVHALSFSQSGVAVVPLDDLTGAPCRELVTFISNEEIIEMRMRMRLLRLELCITTREGNLVYSISRRHLGMPWHRINLAHLLSEANIEG